MTSHSADRSASLPSVATPFSYISNRHSLLSFGLLFLLLAATAAQAAPTPVDDSANVQEDSVNNSINVAGNDGGGAIASTATLNTPASNGTATSNGDGTFNYTPNANYFGGDSFTYSICDAIPECAIANVAITVINVNDAPTANPDSLGPIPEDSSNNEVIVLANDTDPENDTLNVTGASASFGSVSVQGNNRVRYTPNLNYFGADTINYSISDGNGGTDNSTVAVTVSNVNDAPIANDDIASVAEDTNNNPINVLGNDTDIDGDTLSVSAASAPSGTATANGSNVLYTPAPNFTGQVIISYTASDGNGGSDNATATVTVNNQNDPPVANNDTAIVAEDSVNNPINVTANDTDLDGDTLSVTAASATNGTATPSGGNVIYTPNADYSGPDTINYTISDGNGGTAGATVTVTVSGSNDPPVANDDSATVDEDSTNNAINVAVNDTDPDGDTLTVSTASATNGTVTPSGGSVNYTPNPDYAGADTINYTISDGNGGTDNAVVLVTVTAQPDAPVANDDTASVDEDSVNNVIDVAGNDTDADGDTLTVSAASASNGTATPSSGNVLYTPTADYFGPDTISYTISDGNGGTDTAIVSVTVGAITDPPTAANDGPFAIDEGGSIIGTFNVLTNDTNPETTPMTAVVESPPANASAFTLNPNGTFTYTHNGSETLSDFFTYRADNGEPSNVATVTFTINPINDAPVITGLVAPLSTPEDTPIDIEIGQLVILDPDNVVPNDLVLTLQDGANYTRGGLDNNTITPAANFNGQLSIPATVSDLEPLTSPVFLITVEVTAENDIPALDLPIGPQTAIEDSAFVLDVSSNFSDADGDLLTFSAIGLPPSLDIDAAGTISGTPGFADARDNFPYEVTVTARDPAGEFITGDFDLTVSALGRANLGLSITVSPETALPNDQLRWTFTSTNPVGPVAGLNVELTGSFVGNGLAVAVEGGANCTLQAGSGQTNFTCIVGTVTIGSTNSISFTTTSSQATEVVGFGTTEGTLPVPIDPNLDDNSALRAVGVAESFSVGAVQILGNSSIRSIAAGDVNGDGALDLVVGTASGQPVQVYLGDAIRESCQCQRDFLPSPISIPDTGPNEGVALADFDNNGSLDLVVANGGGQPDVVYRNDGAGNFTVMATLAASNGQDVAVGDFDNNGNMDFAVAANSPNPVYFGDGNGGFSGPTLLGDEISVGVAVGRFDGNNRDDLVFANVGADSEVWTKNIGGGFTSTDQLAIGDAVSVAAADLNNDGADDLVFARVSTAPGDIPSNPVLFNQGSGTFGSPTILLGISPTYDVLIGDVSEDGSLDIVFINASGAHQIWTAAGIGYALHSEQIIDAGAVAGVLTDLGFADNGDPGGPDLAMGGDLSAGVGVYLNDSTGNLGRGDAVLPVITLNGSSSVSTPTGSAYTDAGATALDNIDGNLVPAATSNVNTTVVGNYTVTYNVTDFAGNAATPVVRTVTVTPATGRGGGGGGALGYWALIALIGINLFILLRTRRQLQSRRIRTSENNRDSQRM